ncbi:MAG TPA: kelch repeat-containing protein [Terriglobales bacterium]|nr:kelch repeat-containing protein [Terriglobales bacterium]
MKKKSALLLILLVSGWLSASTDPGVDPLPDPVSNNAVALLKVHGQLLLYSFMGMGAKKTADAITNTAFSLEAKNGSWSSIHAVPGTVGRIAAVAATARDQLFLFGGYVLDAQGRGMTVPDVGHYEPARDRWYREADIPLPLGDSVAGVYRDRYIYLVSGRSNGDVVSNVQVYDADKNTWSQATPISGPPVFGHAGALVGDTILYIDGARKNPAGSSPRYVASDECWMGKIEHHDPSKIQWTKLPSHPGTARYRIAAGGSEKDGKIYFAGGTDNPYDYAGIGYDGKPSEPSPVTFDFNLRTGKWETIDENTPDPTMDHRGLLVTHEGLVLIGGMEKGQKVTARVALLSKQPTGK